MSHVNVNAVLAALANAPLAQNGVSEGGNPRFKSAVTLPDGTRAWLSVYAPTTAPAAPVQAVAPKTRKARKGEDTYRAPPMPKNARDAAPADPNADVRVAVNALAQQLAAIAAKLG